MSWTVSGTSTAVEIITNSVIVLLIYDVNNVLPLLHAYQSLA